MFVYVHSMTFARRRNRLTTHFSESIPVVCIVHSSTLYKIPLCYKVWYLSTIALFFLSWSSSQQARYNQYQSGIRLSLKGHNVKQGITVK